MGDGAFDRVSGQGFHNGRRAAEEAAMEGNGFTFGGSSNYFDSVGVPDLSVFMLRYGGWPTNPCGFFVYQNMQIWCPNSATWNTYAVNELTVEVNLDYVYDQRGNAYQYY
jgi:hypothetical protein